MRTQTPKLIWIWVYLQGHTPNTSKMSVFHREQIEANLKMMVESLSPRDTCIFFHKGLGCFNCFDNNELKPQMKIWRKLAKEGKAVMRKCNDGEHTIHGRKFYSLTFQQADLEDSSIDSGALLGIGYAVTGCVYFFTNAQNRTRIREYVMKDIPEPDLDEEETCTIM